VTTDDTIIAFSSVPAASGRIIVRLSGTRAFELANALTTPPSIVPKLPEAASSLQCLLHLRGVTFPAWLYTFVGPRSYTGEDVVELHLPGNVLLGRWVMEDLIGRGARPAEPGEFTARAYFNGRMDLSEAEGVAATIAAGNERELQAARQLLGGELARRLKPVMDQLAETLALTELGIDFSEEDVTFLSAGQTIARLDDIDRSLENLVAHSGRFAKLSHEPRIVLAGRPNAGKSTLLNALARRQRAVVSPVAGTTRDLISAEIALERGMVILIDAAGVEETVTVPEPSEAVDRKEFRLTASDSSGTVTIDEAMRRRALEAIEQADGLVLVREVEDERPALALPRRPDLVVRSKGDVMENGGEGLIVSAARGEGMEMLRRRLDELAFGGQRGGDAVALNDRHLAGIAQARAALGRACNALNAGAEIVALELREALDALGAILGAVAPDELLGRIFSTFCIGK
jgi:tRNA modification GTPase